MSTLQTLRTKAGTLVAVVVGLSLLAFILGDFLNSGTGFLQSNQFEVGEIDGKSISYQEFNERVEASVQNYKRNAGTNEVDDGTLQSIRSQVWNGYLNELLFDKQYKTLGIGVSGNELFDMVQGRNIHPQIQQIGIFQNQQTGGFDRNLVIRFLKNMDADPNPEARDAWMEFEKELVRDRMYTKYQNLISKGLYVPKKFVDLEFIESNKKFSIEYVSKRYASVADSVVKMTEADVTAYFEKHKKEFKQDASRDLSYVTFDVVPSQKDRDLVERWIFEQLPEFQRIENVGQYIRLNSDNPFNELYLNPAELDPQLQNWAVEAEPGQTYGPYLTGDVWAIARLTDTKMMPDSVRASHILIRPVNNTDFKAAKVTADSLLALIKGGASFEALAAEYGSDDTSTSGGDLNWFVQEAMIPEFSKACFSGSKGDLLVVESEYGAHVVKITDQAARSRKVQVGFLTRTIAPGTETYQGAYNAASKFASTYATSNKYDDGVQKENLTKRLATNLRESDNVVSGLDSPREMIRWAYESDQGDVSPIFEFGNRFVIAKLDVVREEGTAPLDQVRAEVENIVRNEKKADYLMAEFDQALTQTSSLEELGTRFGTQPTYVENQYFTSSSVSGVGIEPKLTAAIVTSPVNQLSKPIRGNNAVYVIRVFQVVQPGPDADVLASRNRLEQDYSSRTGYAVFQALEEGTTIKDNRAKFY